MYIRLSRVHFHFFWWVSVPDSTSIFLVHSCFKDGISDPQTLSVISWSCLFFSHTEDWTQSFSHAKQALYHHWSKSSSFSLSLSSFFLFCLPEVGFLWIASPDCPSRQGWCQTQRSACLCLPSPGTKGMCHRLYFYVFNVEAGAREMAPWLRELPALLVDPRSVLRVHVRWLAGAYNLSSRRCKTFLLDYKNMCPHPWTNLHMDTHTHTHISLKRKSESLKKNIWGFHL